MSIPDSPSIIRHHPPAISVGPRPFMLLLFALLLPFAPLRTSLSLSSSGGRLESSRTPNFKTSRAPSRLSHRCSVSGPIYASHPIKGACRNGLGVAARSLLLDSPILTTRILSARDGLPRPAHCSASLAVRSVTESHRAGRSTITLR